MARGRHEERGAHEPICPECGAVKEEQHNNTPYRRRYGTQLFYVNTKCPCCGLYDVTYWASGLKVANVPAVELIILTPDETVQFKRDNNRRYKEQQQMKLYQFTETFTAVGIGQIEREQFCKRIGTNSDGLAVVELIPSKQIATVKPNLLEEVRPYTIKVRNTASSASKPYHIKAKKDDGWLPNDLLIQDGKTFVVTDVNTKAQEPSTWARGRRIRGDLIEAGQDDFDPSNDDFDDEV